MPESVTSIGNSAFCGCLALSSITLPNGIPSISNQTFRNCPRLTSITIPDSVKSIGEHAFADCRNLTNLKIPNSVTSIGAYAFQCCSSLEHVIIPNGSIGNEAFQSCRKLRCVVIGGGVTTMGNYVFSGCESLYMITFSNGVKHISRGALEGAKALSNIKIPNSVTTIDPPFPPDHYSFQKIIYSGTRESWKRLVPNTDTSNGQVICSDGNIGESLNNTSGGCYVATCVYGSYDCPQVWTLRRFRDDTLGATWYGRAFIRTYYAISPTLVKWFGKTSWFKRMWHGTLNKMVAKLNSKGVADTPYNDKKW